MSELRFRTLSQAEEHLERIEKAPAYKATGLWSEAQIFDHLANSFENSVSGYPGLLPAVLRKTIGRMIFRSQQKNGFMKPGSPNPNAPKVRAEGDAKQALKRLRKAIVQFKAHDGEMAVHPAFDRLSKDEFSHLHAMHMANHFEHIHLEEAKGRDARTARLTGKTQSGKSGSRKSTGKRSSSKKTGRSAKRK